MSNFQRIPDANEERDEYLWQLAQKRASFKRHIVIYLLVISFLWILWLLNGAHTYGARVPWPVWPMFGWGIGIVSHYMSAYYNTGRNSVQQEYDKLKNQR